MYYGSSIRICVMSKSLSKLLFKLKINININITDFCKECSIDMYGYDFKDLADNSTVLDDELENYQEALCQDCGLIFVNSLGEKMLNFKQDLHMLM